MATDALVSLGIDLSLSVSENLALVQEDLGPLLEMRKADARWLPAAQLHVALKLVGRIERSLVARVRDCVSGVLEQVEPFDFDVVGVEVLPRTDCPRLVLGRIGEGREALCELARHLDEALCELGIARERRAYRPDVLLGRLRTPLETLDLSDVVEALGVLPVGRSRARDIALLESHLTPRGTQLQVLTRSFMRGVVPDGRDDEGRDEPDDDEDGDDFLASAEEDG